MISFASPASPVASRPARIRRPSPSRPQAASRAKICVQAAGIDRIDCRLFAVVSHDAAHGRTLLAICPAHDLDELAALLVDAGPCEIVAIEIEAAGR